MEAQDDTEKYTGLREDIKCLLERFLLTKSLRFQMFTEEWRRLNFSFIHYGIEKSQTKEVMQEAFRIATDYLLPPYDLQCRVGALYILYALYETQPHVPKFKIRISLNQWQSVTTLMETLEKQGHLDVIYVFHKLTLSKAFMFTAQPQKMIFHTSYMEARSDQNPTERWLDRHKQSLITECFDDTTLEMHHELHEQYQDMKTSLGLHDNTSLMVVRESIADCIAKRLQKLETDLEESQEHNKITDTSDQDTEDRGSRRAQIKARSYSTVAAPSRSRRHYQQPTLPPSGQSHSSAKSKMSVSKGRGKGQQKVVFHSSASENSQSNDSDDATWVPHGVKKQKTQRRASTAPKMATTAKKATHKEQSKTLPGETAAKAPSGETAEKAPSGETAEKSVPSSTPSKAPEILEGVQSAETTKSPGKRSRERTGHSADPKRDSSPDVTPQKRSKGPNEAEAQEESPSKTQPTNADNDHPSSRTLRKSTRDKTKSAPPTPVRKPCRSSKDVPAEANQDPTEHPEHELESASPERASEKHQRHQDEGLSPRGQGSSEVAPSPRGLRSASVRGGGAVSQRAAATRGHRTSPRTQGSSPGDQKSSPSKEHRQTRTPRRNTTLKVRGGGIGARTRGARRNISK